MISTTILLFDLSRPPLALLLCLDLLEGIDGLGTLSESVVQLAELASHDFYEPVLIVKLCAFKVQLMIFSSPIPFTHLNHVKTLYDAGEHTVGKTTI